MKAFATNTNTSGTPNQLKKEKGGQPFFGVQAKLSIGKSDDKFEKEADHVAEKVVEKTENKTNSTPKETFFPARPTPIQRSPFEEVQTKEETEEIQEKPLAESITPVVQLEPETEEVQEKCTDCESEEKKQVQKMPFEDVQQKVLSEPIQKKCAKCAEKEKLQKKGKANFPPIPEGITEAKEEKDKEKEAMAEEKSVTEEAPPTPEGENAEGAEGKKLNDLPAPKKEEKKEKGFPPLQQKSAGPSKESDIEKSLKVSKGGGSSLPKPTQEEMGSSFGSDFSNVRIHTGSRAVQMNQDLGAHAFTSGNDIYFNQGKFNPESKEGKHLLAHELTHTIQQGASGNTVQRYVPPGKKVQPEGGAEKPNDGAEVEGKSNTKISDDERVQDQDELSEEEIAEKKDPPRGEVHQEKSGVLSEGVTKPPVDRGAEAQEKISEQRAQMDEQLSEEPPAGEGGETESGEQKNSNLSEADAAEQMASQNLQQANAVEIPAKPQPFQHPNVIAPVDSAGQPLPRKSEIDTQVRGLGYIGEMLREKGYEMKKHGAEKKIHAFGLDASLNTSRQDLALAKEGTKMTEEHNEERKEISETSKKALTDSQERQQFVSTEAPALAQEADEGKGESSALASDANSKASQSKSEIPDDPDAKADAEQQSGEMEETASGAQSMDDAITQTGERAMQYIQDAEQASKDNQQSEAEITENDSIITQLDGRVAEMKGLNEQSQASIDNSAMGPETIRQHGERAAATGDELIAATIVMEVELNSIQDEYLAGMAAIESKEAAEERIKKEQEEKQQQEASPEELQLYELAGLPEEEQEARIQTMQPEEKEGIMAALDKMIAETPDDGTAETEGKRLEVKLSSGPEGPGDPRQPEIDAVDQQRVTRLGAVLDIADQNMGRLSAEEQKMLAERLVGESITDDIKNISVQQMAKGMLEGMVNPMASLQGVVGGFEKTLSGVANIFNAEAWEKDPLGNLLQIGADISTGLAMVFSSILGIAGMITALMVALTIISWGTLSPVTGPVIGWMGTVMTYAGWGAIVAGLLSVYFNSLAYIKNLNDAGTASTARELFGNTEQMKKNASDGFQGAMAVVEGVGAVKMGPVMKSGQFMQGVPKSPGAFVRQTMNGAKEGLEAVAKMPARAAAGAKRLFAGGKKGLKSFKTRMQGFFRNADAPDIDAPRVRSKAPDGGDLGSFQGRKVNSEMDLPDGHKARVLDDGQCAICSNCERIRGKYGDELKDHPDLETELKGYEDRLRNDPNDVGAIQGQQRIHDDLFDKKFDKVEGRVRDIDQRIKDGDRNISPEEYKQYQRDKRLMEDFGDPEVEAAYQKYRDRKIKEGVAPDQIRGRKDWKRTSDWWKENSPVARGNKFNKKAAEEGWYPYDEVHLSNGKRLDGYDPPQSIISRKATDFDKITDETFLGYIQEIKDKYPRGTTIRSNKYPNIDGQPLKGKYYLEVPISNKSSSRLAHFNDLARKNGVFLRFKPE